MVQFELDIIGFNGLVYTGSSYWAEPMLIFINKNNIEERSSQIKMLSSKKKSPEVVICFVCFIISN